MAYVTYLGENASLTLHGVRFEPKKPIEVDESLVKKLMERTDFEVRVEFHIPLEDLTVVQLRDKAKEAGIEGFADMKKAELIQALQGKEDADFVTP